MSQTDTAENTDRWAISRAGPTHFPRHPTCSLVRSRFGSRSAAIRSFTAISTASCTAARNGLSSPPSSSRTDSNATRSSSARGKAGSCHGSSVSRAAIHHGSGSTTAGKDPETRSSSDYSCRLASMASISAALCSAATLRLSTGGRPHAPARCQGKAASFGRWAS
jgi:hypothetical protein